MAVSSIAKEAAVETVEDGATEVRGRRQESDPTVLNVLVEMAGTAAKVATVSPELEMEVHTPRSRFPRGQAHRI